MLGLTTGCQECGRTHVGPCLSIAPEPRPLDTAITPCLEYIPESPPSPCLSITPEPKEPSVGPCLKYAPPPVKEDEEDSEGAPSDGGAMLTPGRDETRARVLASGVLPEDVIALLQTRQQKT